MKKMKFIQLREPVSDVFYTYTATYGDEPQADESGTLPETEIVKRFKVLAPAILSAQAEDHFSLDVEAGLVRVVMKKDDQPVNQPMVWKWVDGPDGEWIRKQVPVTHSHIFIKDEAGTVLDRVRVDGPGQLPGDEEAEAVFQAWEVSYTQGLPLYDCPAIQWSWDEVSPFLTNKWLDEIEAGASK